MIHFVKNANGCRSTVPGIEPGENLAAAGVRLSNEFTSTNAIHVVGGVTNTGISTQNNVVLFWLTGKVASGDPVRDTRDK